MQSSSLTPCRRIICFGDSITQGAACAEADRWTVRLALHLEQARAGEYEVFNRGVGANTTALALDRFQNDVLPLLPGLVLVEFGINDAYVNPWAKLSRVALSGYLENLSEIARQIRAHQGEVVLIINHPVTDRKDLHTQGNGQSVAANLEPYSLAAKEWAAREAVPMVDLPELLQREGVTLDEFWDADGVHLSPHGNRIYARLVFRELLKMGFVRGDAESTFSTP